MEHIIYCYTNTVNNKKYIGQTNNFERRKKEHINQSIYRTNGNYTQYPIHKAIRKYGIDNFMIEILETTDHEHVDERERYWINEYNTVVPNGYNICGGGKNDYVSYLFMSEDKIQEIQQMLIEGFPYWRIYEQTGCSLPVISNINNGKIYCSDVLSYPLKTTQHKESDDFVQKIKYLLKNTNIGYQKIAEQMGCCKRTVIMINNGNYHFNENDTYPLRRTKASIRKHVIELLRNTDKTMREIAEITGASQSSVEDINRGSYWHSSSGKQKKYADYNQTGPYPIRKHCRDYPGLDWE